MAREGLDFGFVELEVGELGDVEDLFAGDFHDGLAMERAPAGAAAGSRRAYLVEM